MRKALEHAFDNYTEGEEQRQVKLDVEHDFPRFVQKAQEMAVRNSSDVTYSVDGTGNETIFVNRLDENLSITKTVGPKSGAVSFGVSDVTAREKKRLFRAPRIRTSAHINDKIALQRAREFFQVMPVAPQEIPQLLGPVAPPTSK